MFVLCYRDRHLVMMLLLNTLIQCPHENIQVKYTHSCMHTHTLTHSLTHSHTTDQDMGYGPSMLSSSAKKASTEEQALHPPPPPVTHTDGSMDHQEVVPHDSNFIMAKRTEDGSTIRKVYLHTIRSYLHV